MQLRREAFARYGIPWERRNDYELDDLVPLCLGSRQTIRNVWPEPWRQAHDKDALEAKMCRAVCDGRMRLDDAQRYFLDWGNR